MKADLQQWVNDYEQHQHLSEPWKEDEMKVSQLTTSKYLKHGDLTGPMLVTVRDVALENVALKGQPSEQKGILYFNELDKGMVLNKTNLSMCEKVFKSDDTDDWIGKQIVLYVKHDIEYQGEIATGLRLRQTKNQPAPVRQVPDQSGRKLPGGFEEMAHDVPF